MKIPPENLYYVLCYAWERLDRLTVEPRDVRDAGGDDLPQNLLARLLRDGFDRVLRRGLDRGYREFAEETRRPRGKVDLPATVRRALRARGQVSVRYEELSRDVLHNRIVKTTMQCLAAVPELDDSLKSDLMRSARRIPDVAEVELRDALFRPACRSTATTPTTASSLTSAGCSAATCSQRPAPESFTSATSPETTRRWA